MRANLSLKGRYSNFGLSIDYLTPNNWAPQSVVNYSIIELIRYFIMFNGCAFYSNLKYTSNVKIIDLTQEINNFLEVKSGDILFGSGDSGKDVYVLLRGRALMEFHGSFFDDILPGEIVGQLSAFEEMPRIVTALAVDDCLFRVIDGLNFKRLMKNKPVFVYDVAKELARRLVSLSKVSKRLLDVVNNTR